MIQSAAAYFYDTIRKIMNHSFEFWLNTCERELQLIPIFRDMKFFLLMLKLAYLHQVAVNRLSLFNGC